MPNIKIEKLVPGGQGIGVSDDGKKGFFWNALPGEIVTEYTITKNKSHYFEAIAEKIKSPSPYRIAPADPCFLSTSPWQIMGYDYELEQKALLLEEQFRQFGIDLPGEQVQTDGNDFHYRNKMEYSLYWDNETEKISLAFHQRGSHKKIPVTKSSIERPEIFAHAKKIVDDLNACHEEARKYQSLLLRCNQQGEVLADYTRIKSLIPRSKISLTPFSVMLIPIPLMVFSKSIYRSMKWLSPKSRSISGPTRF